MAGEETIEVGFETRRALSQLGEVQEKLTGLRSAAGSVALGVAQGVAGATGATGSAVASFAASGPIEKIATIVEKLATTFAPEVVAKLDVIGRVNAAGAPVKALVEDAARLGVGLPRETMRQLLEARLPAEARAQEAGAIFESEQTKIMAGQFRDLFTKWEQTGAQAPGVR